MKKTDSKSLPTRQQEELAELAALPDDRIDTSDIAEVRDWSEAKRGLFHPSAKSQPNDKLPNKQ